MFHFLTRKGLVQSVEYSADDTCSPMIQTSSAEEWRIQGFNLMDNHIYELAAKCFRHSRLRAEQEGKQNAFFPPCWQLEAECHAHHLCKKASEQDDGSRDRKQFFLLAANAFLEAGHGRHASRCLFSCDEFDLAGRLYEKLMAFEPDDSELAKKCVRCFLSAGASNKAIQVMLSCGMVRSAFMMLYRAQDYEKACKILDDHPDFVPPDDMSLDRLLKLSAQKLVTAQGKSARERFLAAVRKMESPEDMCHFLGLRVDTKTDLVSVLKDRGWHCQAASALADDGRVVKAAELLESLESPKAEESTLAIELRVHHSLSDGCLSSIDHLRRALSISKSLSKAGASEAGSEDSVASKGDTGMALRGLWIELEIARRTSSVDERRALLSSLLDQSDQHVVCSSLSRYELMLTHLASFGGVKAATLEDAWNLLEMLGVVLRDFEKVLMQGDSGNMVRAEQFVGLARKDGTTCVSKWGKVLLDSTFPDVMCVERGDQFVVNQRSFASSLRRKVGLLMLDALSLVHDALDNYTVLDTVVDPERDAKRLRQAMLRVWAIKRTTSVLLLPELADLKPGTRQGVPVFKTSQSVGMAKESKPRSGEELLEAACRRVVEMVCPSLERDAVAKLSEAFPEDSPWANELAAAREAILQTTHKMISSVLDGRFDRKTPHTLSLAITTLESMSCRDSETESVLCKMKRHAVYQHLYDAITMRRDGNPQAEGVSYLRYIRKSIAKVIPCLTSHPPVPFPS